MGRAADRVRRMLTIVPYVVAHPGIAVDDVAGAFDVDPEQVRADFESLTMTGVPPYDPGTLIDVDLDDLAEGRLTVRMADHLRSASRLTRPEAISLYLRGKALLATPGLREAPALASALAKIEAGVDAPTLAELKDRVQADTQPGGSAVLEVVRGAAESRDRLEIDYYSASRDEFRTRQVDPEKVYSQEGRWYVSAWDVEADAERLFRVSRIKEARPTGDTFVPRGLEGGGRALYAGSRDDVEVKLTLGPRARWVAEYYETTSEQETPEGTQVTLPARALGGLTKLLLLLGPDARIDEPEVLRAEVRELAARTLALYDT